MRWVEIPVDKVDRQGNIIESYTSIKHAAEANFMHPMAVKKRCEGLIVKEYNENGHTFRYHREAGENDQA